MLKQVWLRIRVLALRCGAPASWDYDLFRLITLGDQIIEEVKYLNPDMTIQNPKMKRFFSNVITYGELNQDIGYVDHKVTRAKFKLFGG